MPGTGEPRVAKPLRWLQARVCLRTDRQVKVLTVMLMAVIAGLLAMHALSSGHGGHVVKPAGAHGGGHVHTGDHHHDETAGAGQDGSHSSSAEAAFTGVAPLALDPAPWTTSHKLCPNWLPGHCPAVPMLTPMCQAVLSGAGVVLLLLLLFMLGLAAQGSGWRLAVRALLAPVSQNRWRTRPGRLPGPGPLLQELCISRT